MSLDLPVIWFAIVVFATLMYVVMDGFDLGIGILFAWVRRGDDRDLMVNTVAPVWDGNETWLVLGGAGLFGAFPLAYAVIVDALTIPLTLMLLGLIFRGVAFEFRFKATEAHRPFWDHAFFYGSLLATFTQGIVVGAVISGFPVANNAYAGGPLDWLTPFNLFCGLGLIVAYALLGATWLVMKSEGALFDAMRRAAKGLLLALLLTIALISLWTPLSYPAIASRWFSLPNLFFLLPVPLLVVLFGLWQWRSLNNTRHHAVPFLLTLGLIFLGFSGLGISIWPHIIPPEITLWQAASATQSLGFMLPGAMLIIPVILGYTGWSYYVFRGKIQHDEGYH
ncbi:cytochrome d ubiquinol oxidase subunit II [Enterobacter sp. BIGb0383]|uniref:cytochrome d ubiquinol oxidase subunit II n=1 Tax=unclassified Enterobacter TaxID=2608935 RepID=UPI000F4675E0|nr:MULTISPECIES: cytochrome d ubiquinol oxidase subunit II [unclassified Enterobacter]ROP62205.1 cytochrome d ubiquinol oxidase subunit II [Enterobacter sp. BIGb0383]ROS12366.1 cytochrome d ubiquinol oxidase subunit II [Enterobacter sp. BIGb0359]